MTGWKSLVATRIQDAFGNLLSKGTLTVQPTDGNDKPITATAGGSGGPIAVTPASVEINDGAIPNDTTIADTLLTKPQNLAYRITILDAAGNKLYVLTGVQTPNSELNLDTYQPNVPTQALIQVGPQGLPGRPGLDGGGLTSTQLLSALSGIAPLSTTLGSNTVQSGSPNAAGAGNMLVIPETAPYAGTVQQVTVSLPSAVAAQGEIVVLAETPPGSGNFAVISSTDIAIAAQSNFGAQSFNVAIPIAAGQFVGVFPGSANSLAFNSSAGPGLYFLPGSASPAVGSTVALTLIAANYANISVLMQQAPLTALDPLGYVGRSQPLITAATLNPPAGDYNVGATTNAAGSPTVGTAGDIHIVSAPFDAPGNIEQVSVGLLSAVAQLGAVLVLQQSPTNPDSFTIISSTPLNIAAASSFGVQTFNAGTDFAAIAVAAGQFFGIYPGLNNAIAFNGSAGGQLYVISTHNITPGSTSTAALLNIISTCISCSVTPNPTALDSAGYLGRSMVSSAFQTKAGSVCYFEGSSITRGYSLPENTVPESGGLVGSYPSLVAASVWGQGCMFYNDGVDGQSTAGDVIQYSAGNNVHTVAVPGAHTVSPAFTGNTKPCYYFLDTTEVTNDYNGSISTATSIANLQAIMLAAKADGWITVGIVSPITGNGPYPPAAQTAQNQAVAKALRTGVIASDIFIDLSDVIPDQSDSTFYADGTHPNALGHKILARAVVAALITAGSTMNYAAGLHMNPQQFRGGAYLFSPNNTRYALQVDNTGNVTAVAG